MTQRADDLRPEFWLPFMLDDLLREATPAERAALVAAMAPVCEPIQKRMEAKLDAEVATWPLCRGGCGQRHPAGSCAGWGECNGSDP